MNWLNDLEAALSTLTSPMADSQPGNDSADVDARRSRVADVLARHPALADLLPTSGTLALALLNARTSLHHRKAVVETDRPPYRYRQPRRHR